MEKNKDMQFFMENSKMKRKKDKHFLTFWSWDLNPRFSVIFLPATAHDLNFHVKGGAQDQIKTSF